MLQDDKHISENHIKNMVRNIKDTMRSVTNYRPDDTNEYKNNRGKNEQINGKFHEKQELQQKMFQMMEELNKNMRSIFS